MIKFLFDGCESHTKLDEADTSRDGETFPRVESPYPRIRMKSFDHDGLESAKSTNFIRIVIGEFYVRQDAVRYDGTPIAIQVHDSQAKALADLGTSGKMKIRSSKADDDILVLYCKLNLRARMSVYLTYGV